MRTGILLLLLVLTHCDCRSRQKQNIKTMERFNIEFFDSHAVDDELTDTARDGTITTSIRYEYGFTERIIPRSGYFDTYKEFQPDGKLRLQGQLFKKGEFKAGNWQEYREDGTLKNQTNYDAAYKLNVAQVIDISRQQKAAFNMQDAYSRILRNVKNGKPTWIIEWREQPGRIERIFLDDASARVVKRDFYAFQDNQ